MKHLARLTLGVAALVCMAPAALAEEFVVAQKDKSFSIDELVIHVGDVVSFLNNDPFFHNIFSLSSTATFDLGSYPVGESRDVTFTEPGVVEIECAIHPRMKMKIEVVK